MFLLHIRKQVRLFLCIAKLKAQALQKKQTLHGGTRKQESSNTNKEVITDGDNKAITQTVLLPKIEGTIVIAEGGGNPNIKANIIQAVAAVTGVATYKVQVFEMGK